MMKFQRVFLWAAVLSLANISDVVSAANTNKRRSSEELKRLVENPKLGDHIKGKTLRELGVKPSSALRQGGRRDAEPSSDFHLFSVSIDIYIYVYWFAFEGISFLHKDRFCLLMMTI